MADYPSYSRGESSQQPLRQTGWFYEVDGEEYGPVDFRTLRSLAVSRKLLGHHLVWKAGREERQPASALVGLIPPEANNSSAPPQPEMKETDPYAAPRSNSIGEGPPGGLYLPHLTPANIPLYLALPTVAGGIFYVCRELTAPNTATFLFSLAALCLMGWVAFSVIYLHRAWEMMRMLGAHLTGSKAVRFLFVPFFNALWCLEVIFGWARLWNHNVKHHPGLKPARQVWPFLFLLFPVLLLVSQGLLLMHLLIRDWPTDPTEFKHQISLGIWALTFLLTLAVWGQLCRSINFLARKKV